jgi:uncharacterized protein
MGILLEETSGRGFEALDEEECFSLLHSHSFGRVAISIGAIPVVLPVNYHALNGAIYFFTSAGTKLEAAAREAVVSFEIDQADSAYHHGWSVIAVGKAHEILEPLIVELASGFPLRPWAPGVRDHLVQIWPEFISGRRITFGWETLRHQIGLTHT